MKLPKGNVNWTYAIREQQTRINNLEKEAMQELQNQGSVSRLVQMAQNMRIYRRRIDDICKLGVVGERSTAAMYLAVMDSRLNMHDTALALKNAGDPGLGKSFTLKKCLSLFPDEAYLLMTSASDKSLFYVSGGLQFRCIVMEEAKGLGDLKDSTLAYCIRSLISEGKVKHLVTGTSGAGGGTTEVVQKGPISFITTTNLDSLESQLDDRLFTIHPDESGIQTFRIVRRIGVLAAGAGNEHEVDLDIWRYFHKCLKPINVVIPFASRIASAFFQGQDIDSAPSTLRRAFGRLIALIKAVTIVHQFQRYCDLQGRLKAQIADYYIAKQMAEKILVEDLSNHTPETRKRLDSISQLGPCSLKVLAATEGVSKQAISSWAKGLIEKGTLVWVDQAGKSFSSLEELNTAKKSGKAFIRLADSGHGLFSLPDPWKITNSESWKPDGDLTAMFDLNLSGQPTRPLRKKAKTWLTINP